MSGKLIPVRDFTKNQGNVGKNLVREKLPKTVYCELHIIFVSIQVFSRSLFCVNYLIYGFGSCAVAFLPSPFIVTLVQA